MIACGRIESAWPVHGSVLVEDSKVYCAAGRTSYLDGGMYFFKLDLETGEKCLEKNHFFSGCFLWPFADLVSPGGRMLTFDDRNVYGYKEAHTKMKVRLTEADPEEARTFSVALFPELLTREEVEASARANQRKTAYRKVKRYSYDWEGRVSMMVRAMVLTDAFLFTAGPERFDEKKLADFFYFNRTDDAAVPDYVEDALDSYEGRKGARLAVTDKTDGRIVSELALDSAPVFDGMIAADKRLFISMVDGSVVCLEGKQ